MMISKIDEMNVSIVKNFVFSIGLPIHSAKSIEICKATPTVTPWLAYIYETGAMTSFVIIVVLLYSTVLR